MKKFFTILTLSLATVAAAQAQDEFALLFGEDLNDLQVVDPEKTYYTPIEITDMDFMIVYSQHADLYIRGLAEHEVQVTVTSDYAETQFCGINGLCKMVDEPITKQAYLGEITQEQGLVKSLSTDDVIVADLQVKCVQEDWDGTYTPQTITVNVVAENLDTEEVAEATVVMCNTTNGIAAIAVSKDQIKVANNILAYSVSNPSILKVYGITGRLAAKYSISGTGTLSLNNLPKGVYLYTDGTHKGKFIIR